MSTVGTHLIKKNIVSNNVKMDGFNYAIGPCRYLLRFLGTWPELDHSTSQWFLNLRILIMTSIMIFVVVISQTAKIIWAWGDFNLIMLLLTNCHIPCSIAVIKIINIWYHKYVLADLLRKLIRDWEDTHDERFLKIMWKYAKTSRFFSLGFMFLTEGVLVVQGIIGFYKPVAYALQRSSINETTEWPLYMIGSFPFNVQISPYYELTLISQFISMIIASTSFSSSDSFFIVLMFHLTGQLTVLKMMIFDFPKKVISGNGKNAFSIIHAKHNFLSRFSATIEDCFNIMFVVTLIPCTLALCTQAYQLIMTAASDNVSIMHMIFIIHFLSLFLFSVFTYCYVAEILRQESIELSYAAYICDWTSLPAKQIQLLILIIIRAQHPFEITAGKFAAFSLHFYCRILKTSAGYLSMLLAMKKRMT